LAYVQTGLYKEARAYSAAQPGLILRWTGVGWLSAPQEKSALY
jgi:hypothetical protein